MKFGLSLFDAFVTLLLLLVFPALLMMTRGGNAGFYLLLVCALVHVFLVRRHRVPFKDLMRRYWYVHLGMAALFIATVIGAGFNGFNSPKVFDEPSRLAVFPLMLWMLLSLSPRQVKVAQAGYVLGAIVGAVLIFVATKGGENRNNIHGAPIIVFSNIVLLLGMLSVATSTSSQSESWPWRLLRIVAALAGMYASYLSQARGSWIAIPFLGLFASYLWQPNKRYVTTVVAAVLLTGALVLAWSSPMVKSRFLQVETETASFRRGTDLDTSLGTRFQLWHGSMVLFTEHPLLGVGPGKFTAGLRELKERKIITPAAASGFYHSHNDVLFNMSTMGLLGLLAILMTYLAPAVLFWRYLRHEDACLRRYAGGGVMLVMGYVIFGLTDCFFWGLSYTFYCIAVATLAAPLIQSTLQQRAATRQGSARDAADSRPSGALANT